MYTYIYNALRADYMIRAAAARAAVAAANAAKKAAADSQADVYKLKKKLNHVTAYIYHCCICVNITAFSVFVHTCIYICACACV